MSGHDIHLIGSVPMDDAETVFKSMSAALGPRLKRIPDGETGGRLDWVTWLEPIFAGNPALEPSEETFQVHEHAKAWTRYQLKPGVSVSDVVFNDLLWGNVAIESYAVFKRLRDAGEIPAGTKFQVDLVPAHSVIWLFVKSDQQAAIDPMFNEAVGREIDKIAAAIPHEDLAIQLDVASAVFARLERGTGDAYGATKAEMLDRFTAILATLGDRVPDDVDLLYHFCYGDAEHRHVIEPTDMGDMVDLANRLTDAVKRPIDLIHMPVPRDRDDAAYFEPLRRLALRPETQLCLGLVHHTDGLEGTKRRLATARTYARDFAIATECGFGRRDPATIPELLRIHREAAEEG
jgi:hypothetical protein